MRTETSRGSELELVSFTQHSALSTQHSALSTQHSALSTQHSSLSTSHFVSLKAVIICVPSRSETVNRIVSPFVVLAATVTPSSFWE